jgi:hypothetical protein
MARDKKGFVYLIWCESGHHKIGRTKKSVEARLASLRTGCPLALKLIHTIECDDCEELESEMHRHLASKRVSGEWFALDMFEVNWLKSYNYASAENPLTLPSTWEEYSQDAVSQSDFTEWWIDNTTPLWGEL